MSTILRNVLAVVAGLIGGSIVNMGVVLLGGNLLPPPAGVDPSNMESIRANIHLFEAKHFAVPFVAHALGTLVGAWVASWLGASRRLMLALIVGTFFLLGGVAASFMIPAPAWFIAADLLLAYLPTAWLGWKIAGRG